MSKQYSWTKYKRSAFRSVYIKYKILESYISLYQLIIYKRVNSAVIWNYYAVTKLYFLLNISIREILITH
jgi:hypothetical protein